MIFWHKIHLEFLVDYISQVTQVTQTPPSKQISSPKIIHQTADQIKNTLPELLTNIVANLKKI